MRFSTQRISGHFGAIFLISFLSSLALAQDYSVKFAEEVISSIYEQNTGKEVPEKPSLDRNDMFLKTRIMIEVDAKNIPQIIKAGVLNQFQTGRTGHAASSKKSLARRTQNETAGARGLVSAEETNIRPKYGFLDVTRKVPASRRPKLALGEYGNVMLVLKDSLKGRSTWTPEDSLADNHRFRTFYESSEDVRKVSGYAEAQVWGPIDWVDIKEVWVRDSVSRRIVELLVETGLPVFTYEVARYANGDRYHKRGSAISAGDIDTSKRHQPQLRSPWKNWIASEQSTVRPKSSSRIQCLQAVKSMSLSR